MEMGVPPAEIAGAGRDAEAGGASRRAAAPARRRHADRRLLQLQPRGAEASRSRRWPPPRGARARSRCSARCCELGAHTARLHEECGRAAADAGLELLITVGGAAAERSGRRGRAPAGVPAVAARGHQRRSRAARAARASGLAISCWSRGRAASAPTSSWIASRRSSPDAVPPALRPAVSRNRGPERVPLHHVPHRRARA